MATISFCVTLCLATLSGLHCYQWSNVLPDSAVKYVCTGSTATFSWNVFLAAGEEIVNIRWLFQGHSEEVVAILSHGTFVALPAFSKTASYVPNAGIALGHVTVSDRGKYSVEVTGHNSSGVEFTLLRSSVLHVDGLITSDGRLHASQSPLAVFSNSTQQWHTALACGTFTYRQHPPFDLHWTTPAGQVVSSSQYKDGQFLLLLDNPVAGGAYTCTVPQTSAPYVCPHGNSTHSGNATVTVEKVEARLAVLEAENKRLKEQLTQQDRDHSRQLVSLQNLMNQINSSVNQRVNRLSQDNFNLKQEVHELGLLVHHRLNATTTPRVSFHATGLTDTHPAAGAPLLLPRVVHNHGHGYNATTGSFLAAINGTYWFMASTETYLKDTNAQLSLMVDDLNVHFMDTYEDTASQAGSVHAVVRLWAGQRVWLRCAGDSHFWGTPTAFSGFLIYPD